MTIFVIWQLIVTLDSIRNSCDILYLESYVCTLSLSKYRRIGLTFHKRTQFLSFPLVISFDFPFFTRESEHQPPLCLLLARVFQQRSPLFISQENTFPACFPGGLFWVHFLHIRQQYLSSIFSFPAVELLEIRRVVTLSSRSRWRRCNGEDVGQG